MAGIYLCRGFIRAKLKEIWKPYETHGSGVNPSRGRPENGSEQDNHLEEELLWMAGDLK